MLVSHVFVPRRPGCVTLATSLASVSMTRFILALMQRAARNTPAEVDAKTAARVATYPTVVRGVGWALLVLGVGGTVLVAGHQITHQTLLQGILISAAIVSVLVAIVTEFTRVRVEWTDTTLSFSSPWTTPRSIPWDEIVEVTYSQTAAWFVVRGRNGAKIRLSNLLGGLGDLFDEMKMRGSDEVRAQIAGVTAGRC
jgi:hypothetical protein